ncbi:hypothetical protein PR202_ga23780 [Eleusine coracana subsp. coracana]|uniref:NAC domain-containing protein n=1 Tax=Eleusine coracana subsp. coracana TaxID=191504 RepID=A0AAV5D644_ELECO|nr:hypothetical protein PR202_ga23780 [Eleusine coracana subsp. coracana]
MGDHHHRQQQGRNDGANGLELPPGFRFHPSDEEIITSYLRPRVLDNNFTALAIGEADLNKSEPWELPLIANMGENEWYFYSRNDRKYPTGHRANRATDAGYWKATGKDKEIYHGISTEPVLVGMKKTLVFYKGRAPRGVKTNWIMHEYRLPHHLWSGLNYVQRVWAVCRVFHKSSGSKRALETPASEPTYHMTMSRDNNIDLRSMNFSMPTIKFPTEQEEFTMDSYAPFYSTGGTNLVLPELSPMVGMSGLGVQTNTNYFGGTMATTQLLPFYQQLGIGMSSQCSFMAELDSRPTSMLSNDIRMSLDKTNSAEISSMATAEPVVVATTDMDSTWKVLKN